MNTIEHNIYISIDTVYLNKICKYLHKDNKHVNIALIFYLWWIRDLYRLLNYSV